MTDGGVEPMSLTTARVKRILEQGDAKAEAMGLNVTIAVVPLALAACQWTRPAGWFPGTVSLAGISRAMGSAVV